MLLALEGWSVEAIAVHLGLSTRTVAWWQRQFRRNGIAGLLDLSSTNRASSAPASTPRPRTKRSEPAGRQAPRATDELAKPANDTVPGERGVRRGHQMKFPENRRARDVEPRLAATTVELIAVFACAQVQIAGLLEVLDQEGGPYRRTPRGTSPPEQVELPSASDDGIVRLTSGQPVELQLQAFVRETLHLARGRRLHLVTADTAAFRWLRRLRSRDVSTNLVAHVARDSRTWLHLLDVWSGGHEDPSGAADTVRRLHERERHVVWFRQSITSSTRSADEA